MVSGAQSHQCLLPLLAMLRALEKGCHRGYALFGVCEEPVGD